jgi:hypothetical protein
VENPLPIFKAFPKAVQKGIGLFYAAWMCHFVFLFHLTQTFPGEFAKFVWQQLAIGFILGYFIFRIKKWAWVMSLMYSVFLVIYYLTLIHALTRAAMSLGVLCGMVMVMFSISVFFLAQPETKRYFDKLNPRKEKEGSPLEKDWRK